MSSTQAQTLSTPGSRSWLRMRAIARRHAYVLVRSPHRLFDVTLWPLVDVVLFGSLAALEIGLPGIRRECPHFDEWLKKMESFAR